MKNRTLTTLLATCLLAIADPVLAAGEPDEAAAAAQTTTVVVAANAFLDSLAPEQRKKVQFGFAPGQIPGVATSKGGMNGRMTFVGEQYGQAVWSNFPVSDVLRPGLQLGSLTDAQRGKALHLLQAVLSPEGYRKVVEIMGSDQALSQVEKHFAAGEAVYTMGLFGTPDARSPWMLQFGGHHLALNVVVNGAHGALTPMLTGAQPAVYEAGGREVRVLANENDKAFVLLSALDPVQRRQAILGYRVGDLVQGPGHAGEVLAPEGIKASSLTAAQRALLLDLIGEWVGIGNAAYTAQRMAEIQAGLDDTWFAWSGPTTHAPGRNGAAYYRIQGPRLLIEFSPQSTGGDATMHVHTVYRDPTNDYGRGMPAQ